MAARAFALAAFALATIVCGVRATDIYRCPLSCVNVTLFETNTNPNRWTGPTSGTIAFCAGAFAANYVFCPRAWKYNSTYTFQVAHMDDFAMAYYTDALAVHNAHCNSNAPLNTCANCVAPLKTFACVYAFQPCYNTTSTVLEPVCSSACTNVASNCELTPTCTTGNSTGMVIDGDGDGKCYAATAASVRPSGWTVVVALAALLLAAAATLV